MAMWMANLVFFWVVFGSSFTLTVVLSATKSEEVTALNNMYTSMGSPSQLSGWKSGGGDPCPESWKGIKCSGSSVTEINLSGLGISGSMGYQLDKLTSVTRFDLSKNNLNGDLPYQLPPSIRHLDLSGNSLSGSGLPYSISQMSELKYLNLKHNQLKGQLSDVFGKLTKLTEMDLSDNQLTGELPQSFKSLKSLNTLHLENNQLTGTINSLASLPLDDLDVSNNQFTGWVPNELKEVKKLKTGGNSWSAGPAPPSPPGTKRNRPKQSTRDSGDSGGDSGGSGLSVVAIAGIVLGSLVILGIIIAILMKRRRNSSASGHYLDDDRLSHRRPFTPLSSQELVNDMPVKKQPSFRAKEKSFRMTSFRIEKEKSFKESRPSDSSSSVSVQPLQMSPSMGLKPLPRLKSFDDDDDDDDTNQQNVKRSHSIHVASYPLAELQSATGNFATGRLLGEGSIGRVYMAKYADGRVLAVKKIDSSYFQGGRGPDFSEIVSSISKLRHPNIAELVGYCTEQGQHMLVCEYFRNGSLHEFLHVSDDFGKPLTWNTRVRIALGTARAVEYLHEVFTPSTVHKNIKSSNILLDAELNPRLSDCGLSVFHQRTSQNLGSGYNAPECTKPLAYTLKSDVYSFGVVMLELLTGRMPYESKRPKSEQSLVRWASPQLHDIDALANMVDPALRGLYPPKSLSRFADVIALCIQTEPEFRPPMSEVVEALVRLVQRSSMNLDLSTSTWSDDYDFY